MFTVLVRHESTAVESIYQAESVDFIPGHRDSKSALAHVILNGEGLGRTLVSDKRDPRLVFVMNEAGQTVARYKL